MSDQQSYIDLRSDTVTRPTPAMRKAMAGAVVGDDVYREDPTVNRLEERAAEVFGKEAGLFVPTGSMGNNIAVKLHTTHGQEVICEAKSHVLNYELAMLAWFSGCVARPVPTADGVLRWADIKQEYRPLHAHFAPTGLIEIENTHNIAGGVVMPKEVMDEICEESHNLGLKVHLDGARVFHAAEYLGIAVDELCLNVDTVMFCLSKGLGAPAGSMLVGTKQDLDRGRLYRKRLGGGMRQAGVLAAPGLIALEEMTGRLGEDHANAKLLAEGLSMIPGITIDPAAVQTNILVLDVSGTGLTSIEISGRLKERGVLANGINPALMRMVTHFDVTRAQCEAALDVMAKVAA
jgi:threonine aldolase